MHNIAKSWEKFTTFHLKIHEFWHMCANWKIIGKTSRENQVIIFAWIRFPLKNTRRRWASWGRCCEHLLLEWKKKKKWPCRHACILLSSTRGALLDDNCSTNARTHQCLSDLEKWWFFGGEEGEAKALSPVIYGQLKSSLMWREDEEYDDDAATILQHVINSRVWNQKLPFAIPSYYECQDVL